MTIIGNRFQVQRQQQINVMTILGQLIDISRSERDRERGSDRQHMFTIFMVRPLNSVYTRRIVLKCIKLLTKSKNCSCLQNCC